MAAAQSVGGVLGEATWLWNGDVSLKGGGMNVPSIVGDNLLFFLGEGGGVIPSTVTQSTRK